MPQTLVRQRAAYGIPGEFYDDSARQCATAIINTPTPANNIFGRAFNVRGGVEQSEVDGFPIVMAGYTDSGDPINQSFFGYLMNPKEHSSLGTATGTLQPTLTLKNGVTANFCTKGRIFVYLEPFQIGIPPAVGHHIIYERTTGKLFSKHSSVGTPNTHGNGHAIIDIFAPQIIDPNFPGMYLAVISINRIGTNPA
jgi:hypothetical protein